jgi:Trk K+ transport system NAD-binding subunit
MSKVLIIGIGHIGKQVITGLKEELHSNVLNFNFSFIVKNNDEKYRFYKAKMGLGYRAILFEKYLKNLIQKIPIEKYDQVFILLDVINDDVTEIIVKLLARLKKEKKRSYSIIVEPVPSENPQVLVKSRQAFQILNTLFPSFYYFKLEDYEILFRKDPGLTWNLVYKRIAAIIDEKIHL